MILLEGCTKSFTTSQLTHFFYCPNQVNYTKY